MRLLNAKNLTFFEFVAEETRPRYAILSHTWEQDEATFQDMLALSPSLHSKAGYKKIVKCCQVAVDDGFEWVWIDTCCIDKTNHAELSESINSMYRWYQNSAVCYVYLWDLLDTDSEWRWKASLKNRKWFTRGWTLQELIAPRNVDFFDSTWERKGNKHDILTELCEATGIFKEVLSGHVLPKSCCVAERMSWASKRITTRTEDIAYCLLGIFGVHMPMIYGEHKNAFRRLQEEIIRDQNDLSIFAWVAMRYSSEPRRFGYPLLAESPTDFMCHLAGSGEFHVALLSSRNAALSSTADPEFAIVNKGLRLTSSLLQLPFDKGEAACYFLGLCQQRKGRSLNEEQTCILGVRLRKVAADTFVRENHGLTLLTLQDPRPYYVTYHRAFIIRKDASPLTSIVRAPYGVINTNTLNPAHIISAVDMEAIRATVSIQGMIPESHWEPTFQRFFRSSKGFLIFGLYIFVDFDNGGRVELLALIDQRTAPLKVHLFLPQQHTALFDWFIKRKTAGGNDFWEDLPDRTGLSRTSPDSPAFWA